MSSLVPVCPEQLLDTRNVGMSEYRNVGMSKHRNTGILEYWNTESGFPEKLDSDLLEAVTLLHVAPRF